MNPKINDQTEAFKPKFEKSFCAPKILEKNATKLNKISPRSEKDFPNKKVDNLKIKIMIIKLIFI